MQCDTAVCIFPSDADVTEIRSTFTSQRSQLPLIFIATPLNKSSSQWTQSGPSSPVMGRLLLLARESLSAITSQLENAAQQDQDFKVWMHTVGYCTIVPSCSTANLPQSVE